jgi:hypothetical protein
MCCRATEAAAAAMMLVTDGRWYITAHYNSSHTTTSVHSDNGSHARGTCASSPQWLLV